MLEVSIIIPTYNRPSDLKECVRSILGQTTKPRELIIVDDGYLEELPFKNECETCGIRYIYHKKDTPGLTRSRNIGVKLAKSDIIFFLDDDTVLFPDYVEQIMRVYQADSEELIGGVGGAIANYKPVRLEQGIRKLVDVFFLVSGFDEGKVLPSGFCTNYGSSWSPLANIREVDFLSGGVVSYRRNIFDEFMFDQRYEDYGLGEDKDFSYRVSRKFKLIYNPGAKVLHMESPDMRIDEVSYGRSLVRFRYRFFKEHVRKKDWHWLLFYYALFGYTLDRTLIAVFSRDRRHFQRLLGVIKGISEVVNVPREDKVQ